jgi:tetratricopeptide (TPR) repeat protein
MNDNQQIRSGATQPTFRLRNLQESTCRHHAARRPRIAEKEKIRKNPRIPGKPLKVKELSRTENLTKTRRKPEQPGPKSQPRQNRTLENGEQPGIVRFANTSADQKRSRRFAHVPLGNRVSFPKLPMDRWKQAENLFIEVADLPPDERARYLDSACAADLDLRREVESLLDADARNGEGIATAIQGEAMAMFNPNGMTGARIGAYRITSELGRGGMGTVYLAVRDDDQFKKQVAIKVIRPGMDTEDVLSRFRHERQILANLEHPYIGRLLDGGTAPDGRPFLVMEYVPGVPLDVFCDQRNLGIHLRCRLFLKVCEAVSYAHRSLIVHRDLKPSNILVCDDGTPKLLDFGVAKLLTPDPTAARTMTHAAMRILTPDYSGPEQIYGGRITTAADVYSLGAILYELLAGVRPHRFSSSSLREVERVICEIEPRRASDAARRWKREIRGDLDAIISRAMRKEPEFRYASVEQFAADLQRYLDGYPVLARQGDFVYRVRKYLRRNRAPIAAGVTFTALLIGGAVAAGVEARRADRRFEQVRQLSGKFLFAFHDAIADLPGSTPARKLTVETGLNYYDTLVTEAAGNRELLEEIARGYVRLGDVQGNPYEANLGDYDGALKSYNKAAAIRARIVDPSPGFVRDRILGDAKLAEWMMIRGDSKEADRLLRAVFALDQTSPATADYDVRAAFTRAYYDYGDLKVRLGVLGESLEPYKKGVEIWTQLAKVGRNPSVEQYGISVGHSKLADALNHMERGAEAMAQIRQAIAIDIPLSNAEPNNRKKLRKVFIDYTILNTIAGAASGTGLFRPGEARQAAQTAAEIADRLAAADPNDTRALSDVRAARSFLGDILRQEGEPEAALVNYQKALDVSSKRIALAPSSLIAYEDMVMAHQRMARGLTDAGRPLEAIEHVAKAGAFLASGQKLGSQSNRWKSWGYSLERVRGLAYVKAKKWPDAVNSFRAAIALSQQTIQADPENDDYWNDLCITYDDLASAYAALNKKTDARKTRQDLLDALGRIAKRRALRTDEKEVREKTMAKLAR